MRLSRGSGGVYLSCVLGDYRSPTVAACFLMLISQGNLRLEERMEIVIALRPQSWRGYAEAAARMTSPIFEHWEEVVAKSQLYPELASCHLPEVVLPQSFLEGLQELQDDEEQWWKQLRPLRFGEVRIEEVEDWWKKPRHQWCQLLPRDYPRTAKAWEAEFKGQGYPRTQWLHMAAGAVEQQPPPPGPPPPRSATHQAAERPSSRRSSCITAQSFYTGCSGSVGPGPRRCGQAREAPAMSVERRREEATERPGSPTSPARSMERRYEEATERAGSPTSPAFDAEGADGGPGASSEEEDLPVPPPPTDPRPAILTPGPPGPPPPPAMVEAQPPLSAKPLSPADGEQQHEQQQQEQQQLRPPGQQVLQQRQLQQQQQLEQQQAPAQTAAAVASPRSKALPRGPRRCPDVPAPSSLMPPPPCHRSLPAATAPGQSTPAAAGRLLRSPSSTAPANWARRRESLAQPPRQKAEPIEPGWAERVLAARQ